MEAGGSAEASVNSSGTALSGATRATSSTADVNNTTIRSGLSRVTALWGGVSIHAGHISVRLGHPVAAQTQLEGQWVQLAQDAPGWRGGQHSQQPMCQPTQIHTTAWTHGCVVFPQRSWRAPPSCPSQIEIPIRRPRAYCEERRSNSCSVPNTFFQVQVELIAPSHVRGFSNDELPTLHGGNHSQHSVS